MSDPAKRRDPIKVLKLIPGGDVNDLGEQAVEDPSNWETHFGPCFAEVIVKGSREFTRAGIIDADVTHIIRVPYSPETLSINATMRIRLEVTGELCHVEGAYRRDASNREIEILARS